MATASPIPYVPQPINSAAELSALLSSPLADIRRTSVIKPYLDLLNEIAFHQQRWAEDIVRVILEAIEQERVADRRLALFYLFDTFCKNRRLASLYRGLLAPLIQPPFVSTYKYASDVTKRQMDKLLAAWRSNNIFDSHVLDGIEHRLREVEGAVGGKRTADVLGDSDVVHKVSNSITTAARGQGERFTTTECELCCECQRGSGWLPIAVRCLTLRSTAHSPHIVQPPHSLLRCHADTLYSQRADQRFSSFIGSSCLFVVVSLAFLDIPSVPALTSSHHSPYLSRHNSARRYKKRCACWKCRWPSTLTCCHCCMTSRPC